MDIEITKATVGDIPGVLNVFTLARAGMMYLPRLHTEKDTESFITNLVANGHVLVAKLSSDIVGFIQFENGWINHLYVDPEYQGMGIGKRLLDEVKLQHPSEIHLWVFEQNKDAIRFYEREGFVFGGKKRSATGG